MKWLLFIIVLVMSCPRPTVHRVPQFECIREARRTCPTQPLTAYSLLADSVKGADYVTTRAAILVRIYVNQREYERAAALLDTVDWSLELTPYEHNIILLKTERWEKLALHTDDSLLKGIAYYHLKEYEKAVACLSAPIAPHDYRMLYLAKAYEGLADYRNAFNVLIGLDSVSTYLSSNYQNLLFTIFLNNKEFDGVLKELKRLEKSHLQEFVLLKRYEQERDTQNLKTIAWRLITTYPKTDEAWYALQFVQPKTKAEQTMVGKVYYYHGNYDEALKHFAKAHFDDDVYYYVGRIYYERDEYDKALKYFSKSRWSIADYYRGRVYEERNNVPRAMAVYDSLYESHKKSDYAMRGFKRKAFLLEDIGDTLRAVETFLRIGESSTKLRAALHLYNMGNLYKAHDVLRDNAGVSSLYWLIRISERLGEPVDSLRDYLLTEHPLSYYSLVRFQSEIPLDTTPLDSWILQLGDTAISFTSGDSVHLTKALRYFNLNEPQYAARELNMITSDNALNLLYLSRLCADYGGDKYAIQYALRLQKRAERLGLRVLSKGLFELLYPVRYSFSIKEQSMELGLCLSMIWQESLFDPEAVSPANAQGLMQIIPSTAKKIAKELGVTSYALDNPMYSIRFGCHYFHNVLGEFDSVPLSLAGYNAGPVRVKKWLARNQHSELDEFIELIPYVETRDYVKAVLGREVIYRKRLGI